MATLKKTTQPPQLTREPDTTTKGSLCLASPQSELEIKRPSLDAKGPSGGLWWNITQ